MPGGGGLERREECRHHHPSGKRVNGRASEHAKSRAEEEGNKRSGPEPPPQPQVNMATWRNRKRARPRPPYPQEIRNREHNLIQTEEKHEINLRERGNKIAFIHARKSMQAGGTRSHLRRRHAAAPAVVVGGGVGLEPGRGLGDGRQPRLLAHQRGHGGGDLRLWTVIGEGGRGEMREV